MALLACLADVLKRERMPYTVMRHPPAYTAQELAAVSHVRGLCEAKVVICFADDQPVQAIVPAHYRVDLERLRELAGAVIVRLAREEEIAGLYPEFEIGAAPPVRHPVWPSRLRRTVLRRRTGDGVQCGHAHCVALHPLLRCCGARETGRRNVWHPARPPERERRGRGGLELSVRLKPDTTIWSG